jgi:hypothetical protein
MAATPEGGGRPSNPPMNGQKGRSKFEGKKGMVSHDTEN